MTDTPLDRARALINGLYGDPEERDAAIVFAAEFTRSALSEEAVEVAARAICRTWDYEWDGDSDADSQVAPETSDGERPSKALYREAARAALAALVEGVTDAD